MELYVRQIIHKVKIHIDEIAPNDAEFIYGQDNKEMDSIIIHKIHDAIRYCLEHADWKYLEPNMVMSSKTDSSKMTIDSHNVGRIELPDNYVRICYAKFNSWPLYLSEPIFWNDKLYATLQDEYATGTWERPKIALVMVPQKTLELYSAKDNTDGWIVGLMVDESSNGFAEDDYDNAKITIPDKLESAFIYYLAGLTCMTYRDENTAENMINLAHNYMGAQTNKA